MAYQIDDLKATLGIGARQYKFRVLINAAAFSYDSEKADLLCKGASLPKSENEKTEVFVKGRKLKIRGQSKYDTDIELTFYNTENMEVRKAFEEWLKQMDDYNENTASKDHSYMGEIILQQLDGKNEVTASWKLHNAFPISVESVELNAEESNAITETKVTFTYSHFTKES